MTTETFAHLPLAAIVASLTNPRRTFNPERLAELAESIRADGVDTPVLVRPLPAHRLADTAAMHPRPEFELVSGERRFRASAMAGRTTIPAIVRALTDAQVKVKQLTENVQREDLSPLEEAEGYDQLMHAQDPPLTAEQIGQLIGKSRSYVYARLKLLNLGPEGREALRLGHIEPSVALLIARIPSTTVQAQALGNVHNPLTGQALSARDASALIQRQYMLRLAEAKFSLEDATLLQNAGLKLNAGPCSTCPKRTGADPDLFADVPGADVCIDVTCFRAKEQAHQDRTLKAARESGAQVIEGREAQQITLRTADGRLDGYLRLDDKRDSPEKGQTLRQLIGHLLVPEGVNPTLVAMPDHDPVAVITPAQASRLLSIKASADNTAQLQQQADKGSKASAQAAAELQKRKDHERFNDAWRWRVLELAWDKISTGEEGMYSLPEQAIRMLARNHLPKAQGRAERLCAFIGLGKIGPSPALAEWVNQHPDPDRALALIMLFNAATSWQDPSTHNDYEAHAFMVAIAQDRGVDVDVMAVQKEVEAEHTAEIQARTKVQAEKAAAESQTPDLPLPSAAQADGVRGKGKAKKGPAAPAPKKPKTSAKEALQGIAAAMQGEGEEGGADSGPSGAEPDGASAVGEEGRATAPDAGAALLVPGARVRFVGVHMTGQLGRIIEEATFGTGKWLVNVDGLSSEYVFEPHEFEVVADEVGAAA